jgi:predicted metalloprotease
MRWQGRRQSENVEDRRRMGGRPLAIGGGLGGLLIILLVVILGGDPRALLQNMPIGGPPGAQQGQPLDPAEEPLAEFTRVVLADTEDVWHKLLPDYRDPTLVLFSGQVDSACGRASASVGPFYCPADEKVYLDMRFYGDLQRRFQAPGDFAQAYVIAHEVGHHVQKLLGTSDKVAALQRRVSEEEANDLSVRLELQADFYAGVWAHHAQATNDILDPGDIEEALRAASAIGDDRLQYEAQGYVVPESFTHGTSEQRVRWFRRGFETGDMSEGDTFGADRL